MKTVLEIAWLITGAMFIGLVSFIAGAEFILARYRRHKREGTLNEWLVKVKLEGIEHHPEA